MAGSLSLPERAAQLYRRLRREAEDAGYLLNPDEQFARELLEGLLTNEDRFGYRCCPCRLPAGDAEADNDIICPCIYRDADLSEYGQCYCALYVSEAIAGGGQEAGSIPERRGKEVRRMTTPSEGGGSGPPLPVWRCTVCGYLAGREDAPGICPICKAKRDKFERFM